MSANRTVFEFEMALLPAYRAMTERGLLVDEPLRHERIAALGEKRDALLGETQEALQRPDLWSRLKRPDLFRTVRKCACCGGGSTQARHCAACAGAPRKPAKADATQAGFKTLKAFRESWPSCGACGGSGRKETRAFNPDSPDQVADLLYVGLKLPPRYKNRKPTTDEEALQSLVALDPSGLVGRVLRYRKCVTMREVYERLEPDPRDLRVHSVFNPAGTYTNRPTSAEAFYVPFSTNLFNLTEEEAQRDPLYAVRDVIVPPPGMVLVYADLAGAEARVVAALSEDAFLLEQWARDAFWSPHRWTASRIFGVPEADIDKKSPLYFLGKQSRHAFNYGEGPNKFWRAINAKADVTGIAITLAQARECFAGYHRLHPNLDGIWWNRVEEQIKRDGRLENCFGFSCQFYPRFDPETGALDPETLRAAIAWEPQSTIGMLANHGLLELFRAERGAGYQVLLETYDGVMVAADKYRVAGIARALKKALERPIRVNGRELLVPAEVFVAPRRWSESERIL